MMKREYEIEEWEEDSHCFYVRVEVVSEEWLDETETPRLKQYLIPLEVAEWFYFPGSDTQEIGRAMSKDNAEKWIAEREKQLLERINDELLARHEAWLESR